MDHRLPDPVLDLGSESLKHDLINEIVKTLAATDINIHLVNGVRVEGIFGDIGERASGQYGQH